VNIKDNQFMFSTFGRTMTADAQVTHEIVAHITMDADGASTALIMLSENLEIKGDSAHQARRSPARHAEAGQHVCYLPIANLVAEQLQKSLTKPSSSLCHLLQQQ